ncbi:hypothetical protein DLAC_09305 [Tieghemostelium lacteum]|uniref:E2 ubiquitin-conjugating enzyme n=1 Tax=Tieghemostelium lacteum TaxID=361077 RepID=A0A151Z9P2_TIELA|nr:hypothetical protein DLAC_09305 [Tieghemostelium lacteum]|eukprot:KYQ90670.1 hypothetical protein DLAC_09305 [Tieghemostelium lacteum]
MTNNNNNNNKKTSNLQMVPPINKIDFNKVSSSYPAQLVSRVKYEINLFENDPPPGIYASIVNDQINTLEASVLGPQDTPYDKGVFKLEISLPFKYPFEPPQIKFITPIYHPNIDSNGRICLDILYMPPKGEWKPALNLLSVLNSIRLLMSNPNPHDPLMTDITEIYKNNHAQFIQTAQSWTRKHAMDIQFQEKDKNDFRKKRLRGQEPEPSKYEPDVKNIKYSLRSHHEGDNGNDDDNDEVDEDDFDSDDIVEEDFSNNDNNNKSNGNGVNSTTTTTTTTTTKTDTYSNSTKNNNTIGHGEINNELYQNTNNNEEDEQDDEW